MRTEPLSRREKILPETVFVAPEAIDDPMTHRVPERLGAVQTIYLSSSADPITESREYLSNKDPLSDADKYSLGKRCLLITHYRGSWIKRCPGTQAHVCCNLWVVNPAEGCPLDCTYCCLQTYLRRNPTLKMYSNTKDMLREIRQRITQEPSRFFRVCTGELTDSLVWDELNDLSLELVPFFASMPNALLELKTKDSSVANLISLQNEHKGKTVVSWSVNARAVVDQDEAGTASLEQRVCAAQKVANAGYRIGLHFDPLVPFEGWKDGYREAIQYIFSEIDWKDIAWISISPLRYHPEQQKIMIERFPGSKLPFAEQFLAKDNKLRIIQPLRFKMIRFVWNELKGIHTNLPVYMCMESAAAWRTIVGSAPIACSELMEVYSRKGRLRGAESTRSAG